MQKYPHMIELYACTLKIFIATVDLFINVLISFRIWATPKLSK